MNPLLQDFDASFACSRSDHQPATPFSIRRIEIHFGISLPPTLIQLARNSRFFACRFASLGRDYLSSSHIIRVNSYWRRRRRTRRVPRDYVILTNDPHELNWCLDTSQRNGDADFAVVQWSPEELIYPSEDRPTTRYASFDEFLRADIFWRNHYRKTR